MKGIVFTEFLEMVEDRHGLDFCDELLEGTDLASGGVYTSVGTYAVAELVAVLQPLVQGRSAHWFGQMHDLLLSELNACGKDGDAADLRSHLQLPGYIVNGSCLKDRQGRVISLQNLRNDDL